MSGLLKEICDSKRHHVAQRRQHIPESALLQQVKTAPAVRGFKSALEKKMQQGHFGLIAEIKKASPSAGIIRDDFDPALLATAYAKGGAACLSVLTDEPYFQGRDTYLQQARSATGLPVLRKDFMLEPYQIIESRVLGADCVLLIMAGLSDAQAKELFAAATSLGMDVLVEVHDAAELQRALAFSPSLIGINNRNLSTLAVDLAVSETLAKDIPSNILRVCESGIRDHADLRRMQTAGIHCFLVGESLMRQADVTQATRLLLEG